MIFIIFSIVTFLLFTPASNAISIAHGGEAPAFTMNSADGKRVSLSDLKGKVVVMIFWRTDQERSVLALQDAMDVLNKYKAKGMEALGIIEDSDNRDVAVAILKDHGIDFPLLIDKERRTYGDYGVRVFPTTVIIDKQGILAYDIPSHPLTYKTKLRGYVERALGEISESQLEDVLSPHKEGADQSTLEATRLYNLALRFTETQMYEMAIDSANKSIGANPKMTDSHILSGFLYLETGQKEKALASFQKALELAPESNDAKTGLGGAYVLMGEADKAIEILQSAAVANPYPQMTYYELGKAYELKGDKDKSIEMYKKAIQKIIDKKVLPSSVSRCK
ncbi:MAG: redoxin domain-containing protein [Nitrospiraceae bacterium]|nr:MAG: redoxin domain-containing protein [Nitrospiraceae bacterium]